MLLRSQTSELSEYTKIYDATSGMDVDCSITSANSGGNCSITFNFTESVTGPLYLYYEIKEFYQNHRRYVRSRSSDQLTGSDLSYDDVESDCYPLTEYNSSLLNPCGLIANSFFTDIIKLSSSNNDAELDTDGITWNLDGNKFSQVDGFVYSTAASTTLSCEDVLGDDYSDCSVYDDAGTYYYYWYPNDDSVQYLYETFPDIVNPIEGVTNEHFIVWMRTAGLPNFRKYYGKIDTDIAAGDSITFNITTNFEVQSYGGSKALVLTNLANFGAKNYALGNSYIVIGVYALVLGLIFMFKRVYAPRKLGDIKALKWD